MKLIGGCIKVINVGNLAVDGKLLPVCLVVGRATGRLDSNTGNLIVERGCIRILASVVSTVQYLTSYQ